MKRMICAILVVVLLIGMFPITAFAASKTYIEVTKDNAAVRTKADGDAKIALRVEDGTVLESVGTCFNWKKFSNWHEIRIPGKEGTYFIFAGNVKTHEHKTTNITVNNIVYKICSCGDISAGATTAEQKEEANLVLGSATLALPLVDGPLPLGDLAAAAVLIVGACIVHDYAIPAAEELADMISEADFDKYLEDRKENTCSPYTFRRVAIQPGCLKYLDQYCMDAVEAYLYVRLLQGNVYTSSEDSALILAAMFGSAIMERDKATPTKDVTTYFYHYHVGTERKNKAHIFFGLNDLGQGPI